jgi:hypothetical protein
MKRILLISSFSFVLMFLCGFSSKAQYQYTADHPHHHIATNYDYNSYGQEAVSLSFEICSDNEVYVTWSETVVKYLDTNDEWVELGSANNTSSTNGCYTNFYTIPLDRHALSYYFYLEYSDGTYEMVTVDY